jgi:hypothetical protein
VLRTNNWSQSGAADDLAIWVCPNAENEQVKRRHKMPNVKELELVFFIEMDFIYSGLKL